MPNLSFSTQGATPNMSMAMNTPFNTPAPPATNSVSRALSAPPAVPTTPVKKTTQNNVDGSSTVTEYHPPAQTTSGLLPQASTQPLASATSPQNDPTYNPTTGSTASNPTVASTGTPPASSTFGGIVSGLANSSQTGSATTPGYIQNTADYGAGNVGIGQQAQTIADQYGQKIASVGQRGAQLGGGQLTTGTSPVAEGNAAVTAQTTAAQQQALATGEAADLQGIGYQLTGQNQAANAANEAAGQSNTAQGLEQSGLGAAGNLVAPQLGQPGQAYYNPQSGGAIGQTGGVPAGIDPSVWSQYQQDYATGNFGAIPASITGNAQLYGQLQTSAPSGFNYNTAVGQAQGQQALGAAGGTAAAGNIVTSQEAAGSVSAAQTQQIADYQSAQQQGQNLISQANNLISTFGLNPSQLNAANSAIQKIAQNTSSPQYQELSNYLSDIASRYAQILTPPGGSATDSTRAIAASMLNSTAQGTSLQAVMSSLDQQANAVIAGVRTTTPTSTATNSGTVAPSSSSSTSGFGWGG